MSDKIVALLNLQKQIRDADRVEDLGFLVANKTHDLVTYKQSVFWMWNGSSVTLKNISGMATLDVNSPYAIWLKSIVEKNIKSSDGTISHLEKTNDGEWLAPHNYIGKFQKNNGDLLGGIWIERDAVMGQSQTELLSEISECYTHALSHIKLMTDKNRLSNLFGMGKYKKYILLALLLAFFFPVRLSITAPAEIIAMDAVSITMPYDGVLEDISVSPSDEVKGNDVLAVLDKTAIKTELDQANQALKTAQSSLSRAGMQSIQMQEKKQDLQALRAEIAAKKIDVDYARERFENAEIMAPDDGVAIFSDKTSLEGRALRTGEKIMTIANPDNQQLLVRIPVSALLPIADNQPLSFYLNTQPLNHYDGVISTIGYEPSPDPDGLLTYKVRAKFDADQGDLRIGWQGTAKIKSDWSIMGYALLRRPLIALRNILGV